MAEILAKAFRNNVLESLHRGFIAIVEPNGKLIGQVGDADEKTYWRSAAKAFQALPFVASGGAEDFTDTEIALACSSHTGEDFHVKTAANMLAKRGFSESDLQCGVHMPFDKASAKAIIASGEKANQLCNNCSGKHAAMLAFSAHLKTDPKTYLNPKNGVQTEILKSISMMTELPASEIYEGTDGCSAPTFFIPLSRMARAFARLINPPVDFAENFRDAARRIVRAHIYYPEYIGGTNRFDTKLMRALPGRIISKIGAEGIWCAGILPSEKYPNGLGIAVKIEDGNDNRAGSVVGVELLRQLGIVDPQSDEILEEFAPIIQKNVRGFEVGTIAADFLATIS